MLYETPQLPAGLAEKESYSLLIYWAGDGAHASIKAIVKFARAASPKRVDVVVQDPRNRKAAELVARLRHAGVNATAVQRRPEDLPKEWYAQFDVIAVQADRAIVTAIFLKLTLDTNVNLVSYYHVKFPDGSLLSIAHAVVPGDDRSRLEAANLAEWIERVSAPGRKVFDGFNSTAVAAAALCRGHHAKHAAETIRPMAERVHHERHAHEAAVNGHPMLPFIVVPRPLGAGDALALAQRAAQDNPSILEHGRGFEVVQLFGEGLAFHDIYVAPAGNAVQVVRTRVVLSADLTGRICVSD